MFIVSYYFIIKKTVIKYSSSKASFNLSKAYISAILSSIKSSVKSITSSSIYYNLFIFNTIIKNKKTILEYYRQKIIVN